MAKNITKNNTTVIAQANNGTVIRKTSGKSISGRDGIELVFAQGRKLSDAEVSTIKRMGFRWSKNQHLWYAAYSDELFAKAQKRFAAEVDAPAAKAPAKAAKGKTTKASAPKASTKATAPASTQTDTAAILASLAASARVMVEGLAALSKAL